MSEPDTHAEPAEITQATKLLAPLRESLGTVLFGQEELIDNVLTGMLAGGHVLLEGLPGLGKTELVKGIAGAIGIQFGRVQFTPDLLPGDITGNPVLQEVEGGGRDFVFRPGPLFANLVLADEINRASPKTQSALLEAMQERRVTVLGEGHELPHPFFVLATQNPIDLEGTYPLPEAQLDRFLLKLEVRRNPIATLEKIIEGRTSGESQEVTPAMSAEDFASLIALARKIYLPPLVTNFIARLVDATHPGRSQSASGVRFGASPRAAIGLAAAARARALLQGRQNASFEDVSALAPSVLNHRVVLDYAAKSAGKTSRDVVAEILEEVKPSSPEVPAILTETDSASA